MCRMDVVPGTKLSIVRVLSVIFMRERCADMSLSAAQFIVLYNRSTAQTLLRAQGHVSGTSQSRQSTAVNQMPS